MSKTKKKLKPTELDAADRIGMAMMAPARATRDALGVNEFTLRLCEKLGWPYLPRRVQQVQTWLTLEPECWQHPRAGVAKAMLEINAGTQRPGTPDGSLATETRKPGSLK